MTHDGADALEVRFPFDRELVEVVKSLPKRRWNAAERFWSVPANDSVAVVDALHPHGFCFDRATLELYRAGGGRTPLEAGAGGPPLPGLFDAPTISPSPLPATPPQDGAVDLSVSDLNERVRAAIEAALPTQLWLVGEISGFDKGAHRRHVSFELVDRATDGRTLARIPAVLFAATRQRVERALAYAGNPFVVGDEVSVRVLVSVGLYVPWGQYRVVVEEIDVSYTLGETARRREEIVRRLSQAGLLGRNDALELPALPLRVGLVTSLGSDAYNDVLRTLEESGFAFDVTVHGARVQGHSTEPSVLNALDWFRERADRFDALLVCRGGGSRTDLVGFDSEPLGRAVATFPLPVIVGIGHEQDRSVLDAVARSCKTPTAAAALLVQCVRESLDALERCGRALLAAAAASLRGEDARRREHAARVARAARHLLRHERQSLDARRRRAGFGASALLARAYEGLVRHRSRLPRAARHQLEQRRGQLDQALRSIGRAGCREIAVARGRIGGLGRRVGPAAQRRTALEAANLTQREFRLRSVDPRRVLARGYAILRGGGGRVVCRLADAPLGVELRAELEEGVLRLLSRGPLEEQGGN